MDVMGIVYATIVVGAVGLIIGLLLGIAGNIFAVETDEREAALRAALPGNNCGACGYPGCDGLAAAIHKGEAALDQCPVGGAAVAAKLAEIMGVESAAEEKKEKSEGAKSQTTEGAKPQTAAEKPKKEKKKAFIKTKENCDEVDEKGRKVGCIGCGACEKICAFDAIHVVDRIARVDLEKCIGCGACVKKCPVNVIELFPESAYPEPEISKDTNQKGE